MALGGSLALSAGLTILALLFSALSAMVERPSPIRLRHWTEEAGGALRRLYERSERWEAFRLLLSSLAQILPLVLFAVLFLTPPLASRPLTPRLGGTLAATALVVFAGQLANRFLVRRNPEKVLRRATAVYRVLLPVLTPLILALTPLLPRVIERSDEEDEASEEEIEAFLDVGAREGILEPAEQDLILGVIDFGDAVVRSVMTPRTNMVCAAVDTDLETLATLFIESRHSRIPLYRGSVDDIRGILHIRDLLRGLRAATPPPAEELALPASFVPETKAVAVLLRELQAAHVQMAIVVDEYGGTAGVVTVEDLLEEIVGEIVDEHDLEEPECEELEDGAWRVDGGTSIDRLGEIFDAEIDDEPYETVGGLIFGRVGTVPEEGSVVETLGLVFRVESVVDRRIQRLTVRRP